MKARRQRLVQILLPGCLRLCVVQGMNLVRAAKYKGLSGFEYKSEQS